MKIQTISNLAISDSWEGIRLNEVALRQGDLDGACGPYSLMMALLLTKVITFADAKKLWNTDPDGRNKFAKWTNQFGALLIQGTCDSDLEKLFSAIQSLVKPNRTQNLKMVRLTPEKNSKLKGESSLYMVKNYIDNHDMPVILGLDWSRNEAHWVVAVGYQEYKSKSGKQILANILTLDPGSSIGKTSAWNGVLGLGSPKDRKLRYMTEDTEVVGCVLSQGIGFAKSATSRKK
jgi:hypothetical protein